jgi:hypothetical protein
VQLNSADVSLPNGVTSGARSEVSMITSIVIAVVASVVSGLGVAILNHFMSRKRSKAEIEKLHLETLKLRNELDSLRPSATEIIIYDSTKSTPLGHDFKGYGGQSYANGAHYGNKGAAELNYLGEKGKIISICRTNNDGRFHVALKSYHYGAGHGEVLPRNVAIPGMRRIRVSCEVRVTGSQHILWFQWRLTTDKTWLARARVPVVSKSWTPVDKYFEIDPAEECFLRIDDYYETGQTPSEVQIRRIVVSERKTDD